MADPLRIVVTDDHPLYREGVVRALRDRPEFAVVAECADGYAALAAIREQRPEVAIVDLKMPGLDGLQVVAAVERDGLPTRTVVLSALAETDTVYRAVAAGASAVLSKDAERADICDAVAAVARGEVVLGVEAQGFLAGAVRDRHADGRPSLSPREQEILALIAEGLSAPAIGRRLHLSTATVKSHLQSLYEKLGVQERAAAVAAGMRQGLLE
jgi:two-component system nitrate/nitrite response regulator NarL